MILITGGAGFIGYNTARYLVKQGQEVVLVRRRAFKLPSILAEYQDKQVKTAMGDILELPFLYKLIKDYKVDSIIHLAMMREGLGSLYQVLQVNLEGTIEVLEAARVFGIRRVTFSSSEAVYSPTKADSVLHEDMDLPTYSTSYMNATKKAGEQICQLYAKDYGLSIPVVRPPSVWGPLYHSGLQPVQRMVENAIAGMPTDYSQVFGDRLTNSIYIKDCARAIGLIHLAPSLKHNIYNISDIGRHSLSETAAAIREVIPGAQINLGKTRSAKDADLPPMSTERIKEELGFTPEYDLKRGIRDYIDWLREGKY